MDQASPFKLIVWAGVYLLAVLLIMQVVVHPFSLPTTPLLELEPGGRKADSFWGFARCGLSGVHYIHRLARERDGWDLYQARLKLSIVATFSACRSRGSGVVHEEPDLEANVDEW